MNTATLAVSLPALAANYRLLAARHAGAECAAVVKANAYGLGVEEVSKALAANGCKTFFVATLAEAVELRGFLPDSLIAVFSGVLPGEEREYAQHRLTPVINDPAQIERVQDNAILHIDTGMTRLGITESDLTRLPASFRPAIVMSHLACASMPAHAKNAEQLARFKIALAQFPGAKASLANSAGLFLSPDFHFDIARPGCALYGINPGEDGSINPMQHVATLSAPILQLRTLDRNETVGYGATYPSPKASRIAVTGIGYSDGMFRSLGNKGFAHIAGHKVPFAGRVSMDMIALDVSAIPEALITQATRAEFINAQHTVDDLAEECGTIGYEIFTRIGRRVKRVYS